MGSIKKIDGRSWDAQTAALEMDRFEFIAYFLARRTRTAKMQREEGMGYRVAKRRSGWVIYFGSGILSECATPWHVFECMRRTAANYLIQMAEGYRIDVHMDRAA